jgi:hypothetical protein
MKIKILFLVLAIQSCLHAAVWHGQIDGLSSYYSYREPGFMKIEGLMSGASAGVSVLTAHFYFEGRGDLEKGNLHYTSPISGNIGHVPHTLHEMEIKVGLHLQRLVLYSGLGLRYLDDNAQGLFTNTGHFGFDRESRYIYLPIGVSYTERLSSRWEITPRVEGDILLQGTQTNKIQGQTVTNKQRAGDGVRVEICFLRHANKMSLVFTPFISVWDISQSNVTTSSFWWLRTCAEPRNITIQAGCKLGIQF